MWYRSSMSMITPHKVERIKGELFEEKRPGLDILLLGLGGNGVDHTDDNGKKLSGRVGLVE